LVEVIETTEAPEAVGAYSQGTIHGDLIFTSGQIAIDPETGSMLEGDFRAEATVAIDNMLAVVRAGGGSRDRIVKTTVFLDDISNYSMLNEVYSQKIGVPLPSRSVIEVRSLPKDAQIEIEAIAGK